MPDLKIGEIKKAKVGGVGGWTSTFEMARFARFFLPVGNTDANDKRGEEKENFSLHFLRLLFLLQMFFFPSSERGSEDGKVGKEKGRGREKLGPTIHKVV